MSDVENKTCPGAVLIHAVILVDSEARVEAGEGRDTPRNVQNTGRSLERDIIVKNLVPVCVTVPKVLTSNGGFIPIIDISFIHHNNTTTPSIY